MMMSRQGVLAAIALTTFGATVLGSVQQSSAATDARTCFQQAAQQRTTAMRQAYSEYNTEMSRVIDDFGRNESTAVNFPDPYAGQTDVNRAFTNYNYGMNQAWQTLNSKLNQAWASYQTTRNGCGNIVYNGVTYQYASSYGNMYGAAPAYASYSYPQYQTYPNYQYGYPSSYPSSGYPYPYGFGQPACIQQPLSVLPAGCYYECQNNANGCPRCSAKCNSNVTTSDCGSCPSNYAPVCGTDRRTYDNACLAVCRGRTVQYTGVCY